MRDFFDLNNDGKLDSFEESLKDAYILHNIQQLEELEKEKPQYYDYSSNRYDYSGYRATTPTPVVRSKAVIIWLGIIAVICLIVGVFEFTKNSVVGGLSIVLSIIFLAGMFSYIGYTSDSKGGDGGPHG